ncbi:MAG: helix-turn-helix domain-containing protein [Fimbriimonas sp.]
MANSRGRALRAWKDIVTDATRVYQQSDWGYWSGVQLIHMEHRMRKFEMYSDYHCILVYTGEPARFTLSSGAKRLRGVMVPDSVTFLSSYSAYDAESEDKLQGDIGLKINPDQLAQFALDENLVRGPLEFRDAIGVGDTKTAEILKLLNDDLALGSPSGRLYGDSLVASLSASLVQRYGTSQLSPADRDLPLDSARLRLIQDFIRANLAGDVRLVEIARVVGYSPYHLHRLFRQTTGMRLHEYVTEARLERASHLLRQTSDSVAMVAIESGLPTRATWRGIFGVVSG